ncbi:SEC14-like protein 2 [Caerostris darwini]|uniref:SEC14-like protein 2 n=1 Tax=Caerostris darwini TaxID=1538125 RepID=A0AAV4QS21_9ARAC|nr:SEC14-like protein 2 [Caerostris darwini]
MTHGDFAVEEARYVVELRRRVKGLMSEEMYADDDLFQRFLRARGYNLDAAEDMLKKHLLWRKQNKVDTMLVEYKAPEVVKKYLSMNSLGFDKDGYPVNYCEFGSIDTKGLAKCVRKSEINKYMMHHLELDTIAIKKQTEVLGRKIDRWTYIFNFENFSLASATDKTTIDVLIMLVKMYDGNYPERLKTGYLINASFYFTIFWSVVKPFLSAETCRKIKIFGKEGWQEELKNDVGADVLPGFLAGKRTDPDGDPMCNSFINHGGPVPDRYYVHRDRKSFSKLPGVKRLVVNRRSKVNIKLEVNEPGSNIEWDFDLKNRDIGFSLIYEDPQTGKGSEEIVPKQRVDTIIQSESGMLKCDKPGVYILQFDNTYSWMHNKIIYYFADVVNPDEIIPEEDED